MMTEWERGHEQRGQVLEALRQGLVRARKLVMLAEVCALRVQSREVLMDETIKLCAVVKAEDGTLEVRDLGECTRAQGGGFGCVVPLNTILVLDADKAKALYSDLSEWMYGKEF